MKHLITSLFVVVLSSFGNAIPTGPNIILILADDLGYGELGCYGITVKTPHIDCLATEGMRCTGGYAAFPVCSTIGKSK